VVRALYRDLTGQPPHVGQAVPGRKWVVENFDLVASPTYIRDGSFTVRTWLASYAGVREAAWFAVGDLRPFITMGWRSLRWMLKGRGHRFEEMDARQNRSSTMPARAAQRSGHKPGRLSWKRPLDLGLATVLLVGLSPVMACLAVMVLADSKGPVLFRQQRVGRNGEPFEIWKFRSMHVNSDHAPHRELAAAWFAADDSARGYKSQPDRRVTRIGRLLRRTSLDELPQLFNVVMGDMSLVGPRPAIPYELAYYAPQHFERQNVPPGITGLWQVHRRDRLSAGEMMKLDLAYVRQCSPWLDLKILVLTIPALVADLVA
jgi:lipopolysaccharide/colanic/teichoic acid biosynthesis glycosyltransferase